MRDADEACMPSGGIPTRLRFRANPAPFSVGAQIPRLQHERLQGRLTGNLLLEDARQIIWMQDLAPVENQRLLVAEPEKIQIGLVGEGARAIEPGHPDRHRGAVGDQAEALLAFAQGFLCQHAVGNIDMRADQPQRVTKRVAIDPCLHCNPAHLAVARPDNTILRCIVGGPIGDSLEERPFGLAAILGVDAPDPIVMGLPCGLGWKAVDRQIFRRPPVTEAAAKIDLHAADAADFLNPRQFGFAIAQGLVGIRAFDRQRHGIGRKRKKLALTDAGRI